MNDTSLSSQKKTDALENTVYLIKYILDQVENLVKENKDLKTKFQKDAAKLLSDENDPNRVIELAQRVSRIKERIQKNFFKEELSPLTTKERYNTLNQQIKEFINQSVSTDYENFFRCIEKVLQLILDFIAEVKVEYTLQKIASAPKTEVVPKPAKLVQAKLRIPILEDIAAGLGRTAENRVIEHLMLDDQERKGADFGIRVVGDSMKGLGIFPGDIALIRQQPKVETGEVAAIVITTSETDTLGVLKQFYRFEKQPDMRHWLLKSSNPVSEHLLVIPNGVNVKAIQALYDKEIQERRMRNKVRIYTNADLAIAGKYVGLVRKS